MVVRILKYAGAVLAGIIVFLIVYGVLVEPRLLLDERHFEAEIPNLDDAWVGQEVAVISDLQVGMWFANTEMIERIVDRIVDERPAVVLMAGDFLYSHSPDPEVQIEAVLDSLAPVSEAGIPMVAVLGNHDYLSGGAEQLTVSFEAAGISVLSNDVAPVPLDGRDDREQPLYVVGIAPAHSNLADITAALAELPADQPRLVMMHNPDIFPRLPENAAPLAVAGHTHCGQIAAPGIPHWSWLALTTDDMMVADGFAPESYGAEGNLLYVNCGIGFSDIPVRINAPPQLTFFELLN